MKHLRLSALIALGLMMLLTQLAWAHERRTVGKYQFVVGFLNEPSYANEPNAIDLHVTNTETNKPVEGIEKTVQGEVIFGGKTMKVALAPRFGQPGTYEGDFIPTKPGTYIFHFSGAIEGTPIDEKFESGPNTFEDVDDPVDVQFPEKNPSPLELTKRIQAAENAASGAQTWALLGVGFGVLGLAVGVWGWTRRK